MEVETEKNKKRELENREIKIEQLNQIRQKQDKERKDMVHKNQEAFRKLMEDRKAIEQGLLKPPKKSKRSKTPNQSSTKKKQKRSEGTIVEQRDLPVNNIETINSGKQSILQEWSEKDLAHEEPAEYRFRPSKS